MITESDIIRALRETTAAVKKHDPNACTTARSFRPIGRRRRLSWEIECQTDVFRAAGVRHNVIGAFADTLSGAVATFHKLLYTLAADVKEAEERRAKRLARKVRT